MSAREGPRTSPVRLCRTLLADLVDLSRVPVDPWNAPVANLRTGIRTNRPARATSRRGSGAGSGSLPKATPFVAVAVPDDTVRFATGGPHRDLNLDCSRELSGIRVLGPHRGIGVGTALVGEVARHPLGLGRTTRILGP